MRPADPPFDRFGLPSKEQLKRYRIWDSYFTPAHSYPGKDGLSTLIADIERSRRAIEIGQIEKLCYFPHVGIGTTTDPELESLLAANPQVILAPLENYPDQLIAMLQVNGRNIQATLDAIDYWVKNGPMRGAYFPGGGPGAVACSDRSLEPIIRRLNDLNAVIIQHTWFKTGGKSSDRESTPSELVDVAARFPDQIFIAAHAGGEWEKGIRAVRDSHNIWVETSGFDATSGFIEMAVREIGAKRIIFGSHLPSRSLGTELSKVLHADISEQAKHLILGENYRRLLQRSIDRKSGR